MVEAIEAGIFHDLGSGSNVDVVVILKNNVKVLRNYKTPNQKPQRGLNYTFKRNTTAILSTNVLDLVVSEESMDLSL